MGTTNYICLGETIIGEESIDGVRVDYAADALGSVTGTLISGALQNTYIYKPFGDLLARAGVAADPSFMWVGMRGYRATGNKYADRYVRARTYSSAIGRWTTVDSLWPKEAMYNYASGSPSTKIDPSGMQNPVPLCGNDPNHADVDCAQLCEHYNGTQPDPTDGDVQHYCILCCVQLGGDVEECTHAYCGLGLLPCVCPICPGTCPAPRYNEGSGCRTMTIRGVTGCCLGPWTVLELQNHAPWPNCSCFTTVTTQTCSGSFIANVDCRGVHGCSGGALNPGS
jgi:RHS repeat-associated protein